MKTDPIYLSAFLVCSILFSSFKVEAFVKNRIILQVTPFQLSDTRLLSGSPFKNAMDKDAEW